MIKAILFDMDGVLIDNDKYEEENVRYILDYYAKKHAVSHEKAEEKLAEFLKPREHTKEWHDWRLLDKHLGLENVWIEASVQNLKCLNLIEGACEMLDSLHGKYRLCIASDAIKEVIDIKLGYFGVLHYFDNFFSQDSFKLIKNEKQYFEKILEELNLDAKEVVLVDDRHRGITTAREMGIYTILVPYEYKHVHVQPLLGNEEIIADAAVQNLSEIPGIIAKLRR